MAVTYKLPTISSNYQHDLKAFLTYHGTFGRDMIQIFNDYVVFQTGYGLAVEYDVVETPDYFSDTQTLFNSKGQDGWKFVTLFNSNSIFKRFGPNLVLTP